MHNESLATPQDESVIEKPSKLQRIAAGAIATGIFVIPAAITAGSIYYGIKMQKMQYETAQLNLEAARNAAETE